MTHTYYPTASQTTITLTQTIDCNTAKTELFTVETLQVTTTYSADLTQTPFTIRIRDLDGFFADSDIKLARTEDGRLQSIDQSTTGQGAAIIKAAVSVVVSAAALGAGEKAAPTHLPECDAVKTSGGGKPVTLTYTTAPTDLSQPVENDQVFLYQHPSDPGLYDALSRGGKLPTLAARLTRYPIATSFAPSKGYDVVVTLQRTEQIKLSFRRQGVEFANGFVVVPTKETYTLPIPQAAIFGKQSFSLALASSGAITSIEYGKTTGAADAANSLAGILQAPPTVASDIDTNLKTQNDIIAQQARAVRCKAQPQSCT